MAQGWELHVKIKCFYFTLSSPHVFEYILEDLLTIRLLDVIVLLWKFEKNEIKGVFFSLPLLHVKTFKKSSMSSAVLSFLPLRANITGVLNKKREKKIWAHVGDSFQNVFLLFHFWSVSLTRPYEKQATDTSQHYWGREKKKDEKREEEKRMTWEGENSNKLIELVVKFENKMGQKGTKFEQMTHHINSYPSLSTQRRNRINPSKYTSSLLLSLSSLPSQLTLLQLAMAPCWRSNKTTSSLPSKAAEWRRVWCMKSDWSKMKEKLYFRGERQNTHC